MRINRWHAVIGVTIACLTVAKGTHAADAKRVRFSTSDGIEIVGDYYGPREADHAAPIAVLLHMYRSDKSAWRPLAGRLHEAGFAVLAIDMRGHGESGGSQRGVLAGRVQRRDPTVFRDMYRDVAAAHDWLTAQAGTDPTRVALVGASVGCSVAIDYAARDPSVDAVVALTPGTGYLGLDSTGPIAACGERSILLMATEGERDATDVLARLNRAVKKEIVGSGIVHGTRMFGNIDNIESRVTDFLLRSVGRPPESPVVSAFGGKTYFGAVEELRALGRPDSLRVRWYSSAQEAESRGLKQGEINAK